jgi:hypothetical protein
MTQEAAMPDQLLMRDVATRAAQLANLNRSAQDELTRLIERARVTHAILERVAAELDDLGQRALAAALHAERPR